MQGSALVLGTCIVHLEGMKLRQEAVFSILSCENRERSKQNAVLERVCVCVLKATKQVAFDNCEAFCGSKC